jgi:DnaJ-class molecular chaperone
MSSQQDGQTYYELLEVKPTAGPSEIYSAYQRARNTYSPNSPALYSMFTPEEAKELMKLIEEAYQTLSHQARRREYNANPIRHPRNRTAAAATTGSERSRPPQNPETFPKASRKRSSATTKSSPRSSKRSKRAKRSTVSSCRKSAYIKA